MRLHLFIPIVITLSACSREEAPPPVAHDDINPNAFIGTPREAAAKLNETMVLRDNPQMAVRSGAILTIRYRDKDLVTYTDAPGEIGRAHV